MLKQLIARIDYRRIRDFVITEYIVLIAIAIASALVFWFFEFADDVTEGDTHLVDTAILEMFRAPDDPSQMIGPFWYQEAVRDITALGSFSLLALIVTFAVIHLLLLRKVGAAVLVGVSIISGSIAISLLKSGFDRPRPDFSAITEELSASFPSGHAMASAVTFLTLGALLSRFTDHWRLKIFYFAAAVVLTMLVGTSRVLLGVHYPSDVIAGWALGAAWALLWTAIASFLRHRKFV